MAKEEGAAYASCYCLDIYKFLLLLSFALHFSSFQGRLPKGLLVAWQEQAEVVIFGTGASVRDGVLVCFRELKGVTGYFRMAFPQLVFVACRVRRIDI